MATTMQPIPAAFRYPGSKEKTSELVIHRFPPCALPGLLAGRITQYCEPMIGGGAIAMKILASLPPTTAVVLGDKDAGVVSYWRAVLNDHLRLIERIHAFHPTPDEFYRLKELDPQSTGDPVEDGFRKLVLHQISFSGLGARAGSPIGGRDQSGKYKVGCRYNKSRHDKVIRQQHRLLSRFSHLTISNEDFADILEHVPKSGFAYVDPPYFTQGSALYVHSFTQTDHQRLADILLTAPFDWALSYDDHPSVRELYGDRATYSSFEMTATIDQRKVIDRRRVRELVVTRKK